MSSESEHDGGPPLLSWESVVRTASPQNALGASAFDAAIASHRDSALQDVIDSVPLSLTMAPIDFDIAPISLDFPKVNSETLHSQVAPDPFTPKSSEFHFDLNEMESSAGASTTIAPQPSEPHTPAVPAVEESMLDSFELKIAPLDMADLAPSGRTWLIDPVPGSATPATPAPFAPPSVPLAQVVETHAVAPQFALQLAPQRDLEPVIAAAPSIPGLPADPVSSEPAPTTVIPGAFEPQNPTPTLPPHQPMLATAPQTAAPASRASYVPEPAESGQKHQKPGGGGIALLFMLLVLVGLVAGAAVYGGPYLFPEEGNQFNDEATETGRGADIA
ncbi:MAG: hypothetical protein QMC04_06430, partial [Ilumatobacter sp.]